MKAAWKEERCPANTSPKARALGLRLDAERETSTVLRIDDSAVLRPNVGAEDKHLAAFFFLQMERGVPTHSPKAGSKLCSDLINIEHETTSVMRINPLAVLCYIGTENKFFTAFVLEIARHINTSLPLCPRGDIAVGLSVRAANTNTKKPKGVGQWAGVSSLSRWNDGTSGVPKGVLIPERFPFAKVAFPTTQCKKSLTNGNNFNTKSRTIKPYNAEVNNN